MEVKRFAWTPQGMVENYDGEYVKREATKRLIELIAKLAYREELSIEDRSDIEAYLS